MWGLWENPEVMNDLIAQYQQLHPNVTINYEDRSVLKPLSSYKERVFTRLSEEGGPDIVRVHNSWVPRISAFTHALLVNVSGDLFYDLLSCGLSKHCC